jgi:hypothetical protein
MDTYFEADDLVPERQKTFATISAISKNDDTVSGPETA